MAGLCGWFNYPLDKPEAQAQLKSMTAGLPGHRSVVDQLIDGSSAGHVQGTSAACSVYSDAHVMVAIEGTPRWRDAQLNEFATAHGFAASVGRAFHDRGPDAVGQIMGGFALAIHDLDNACSFLAVDNMGRRPLAYTQTKDGAVFFATNATAIRACPGVSNDLDPQSIYNYVYFHVIPSPRTIFAAIRKVPPGQLLRIENGRITSAPHWRADYATKPRKPDGPLMPVIHDAVGRCYSEGSTGCFLSGGLDSSTVAGALNAHSDGPARAFTIGFSQEGYDEIEFARTASKHFNLKLNEYYITADDVAGAFGEVALAYDEPFGNSSAVPTLICARMAAAQGVTSLLAGDGGDELFAGNERYATQKLFGYYQLIPGLLRRGLLEPFFGRRSVVARDRGFQHKVRRYIEQANIPMPARTQTYNLLHTTSPEAVFNPDFLSQIDRNEPLAEMAKAFNAHDDATPLDRLLQMDWKFTLADNDLRKVGRMCDLAGVTVHYPLLDDEIIEHSIRVPSSAKLRRMELRSYFKNATRDFLPEAIINKTKHGFGLPFGEWLRRDDALRDLVGSRVANLKTRNIFAPAYIDTLLAQHQSDHAAYYGNFVWVLAMFEEWCQQHNISP